MKKIYDIFKMRQPMMILLVGLLLLLVGLDNNVLGQVNGDYRSYTINAPSNDSTGYWNNPTTWQRYNGTAWVTATVVPTASNNVTIMSGNIVLVTIATAQCANLSVIGTLTISNSINVSGTTTVVGSTGRINHSSTTGTKTFTGLVTIGSGAQWNNSANDSITFQGGLTNNGTFTAGTGVCIFNTTASQVFTGIATIANITVTGVTLTNNGTLTVSTALSGTGGLTQGASSSLNIGGTSGITTITATNSGNTVNYNGTAQTVKATTYHHLTISSSGTKTAGGIITVNGDLTLSSGTTFAGSTYTHNIKGNWTNNGATYTPSTGTINFNSTTIDQNINGSTTSQTFNNITVDKSSTKLIISGSTTTVTVGGTLTMTSGNINCGTNTLQLGTSTASVGTLSYTAGNIIGNFKRWINATGTGIRFPLGTSTGSGSIAAECNALVTFTNLTNGSLTGKFIATDPGSTGLPLTENSRSVNNQFTEGYWSLVAADALASINYALELTGTNFSSYTEDTEVRIIKRATGGSWVLNGTHVAGASFIAKRSGLSGFSEFAHAKSNLCPTSPTTATKNPNIATVCAGTTITLSSAATGGEDASCTIEYRYSTDGGTNWSSASSAISSFAAVANGNNIIQARRNNCTSACTYPTAWNTVATWAIDATPVAPTLGTASPTDGNTI